ncbi:MAG: Na+/H+ antiporter NhaC family protein [Prevotella sp.]|nr:Na+/H+ antiporter NhaC family protein [Prevotella sp.]
MSNKKGLIALSPLIVFIGLYLITSIIANDFYAVPISVAFLISSIYAVTISRGSTLSERIVTFSRGAGTENIMQMLWIFVLAGAFASTAREIGCIDSTVNLMLRILPGNMVLSGIFLATCIISLSIGTSVGTIVALVPIAAGLAQGTGTSISLMTAVVVGGAFFGDNLSFISDTTIAATSSQGCRMSDKFKANSFIAIPAAIVILILYTVMGLDISSPTDVSPANYIKILPYAAVLITAFMGFNVMTVLTIGIALTGIIGFADGSYNLYGWFSAMGKGVLDMSELIIITMLAGGLFEVIRSQGGIDYIIQKITRHIHGKRGAEFVIGSLVALADVCTANNTVAIITIGGIAKKISDAFGIDNRRTASILDTAACFMQGIIPYGAQILMAAGLARLNPIDILPYLYYPYVLGLVTVLSIIFRFPKKYA